MRVAPKVGAGGGDERAVDVEGEAVERARVTLLQQQLAARLDVPQPPRRVEGGGAHEAARRVEGDAREAARVALELADGLGGLRGGEQVAHEVPVRHAAHDTLVELRQHVGSMVTTQAKAEGGSEVEVEHIQKILPQLHDKQFKISFEGMSSFGEKIVYAEVEEGASELRLMNEAFLEAFEAAGFDCDSRYTPHMTVMKVTILHINPSTTGIKSNISGRI